MAEAKKKDVIAAPVERKGPYLSGAPIAEKVMTEKDNVTITERIVDKIGVSQEERNKLKLDSVEFVEPGNIQLFFADGQVFSLAIGSLGMPVDRIDWPTLKAAPDGEKAVVKGIKGDSVPIDSATLRYLVDANYAAEMDATLKSLQFTDEELERLDLDEPPAGFLAQPNNIDLTRESWK